MDKDTRNAIERATQRARKLLEDDFAAQLEGTFDVLRDGSIAPKAGSHLAPRQVFQRDKILAAIEHKRAAGMSAAGAVTDYLRDAAFTTLNRFVALKMLEARELVQECITKGEQSAGYREFCGLAPGVALLPESAGYRLYIESLFDELSTEVKVLFDRRDAASVLWSKRATFEALLAILKSMELASVWGEDETIGWIYQYFNSKEERAAMRDTKQGGSQAPRNSRELAVRNQFFTPRYVVQFLTDNTLGRIWYEMRAGQTALVDRCEYLVRRPDETYLPRAKKDPRDIRVLDPACGSGHFLLYAFYLLLVIYDEAFHDPVAPKSEATGKTLAADYPNIDALRRALPALILAHNLYGVDIDPRCAQIAQLGLWMRAQRAFRDFGIDRAERLVIRRSNIVVAERLITDDDTTKEFLGRLADAELGRLFTDLVETLELAGDLGLLLRVETLVARGLKHGKTGELFAPPEARIRAAIANFVAGSSATASTRRRLFADDAAQGVGLLETAEKRFDVVLMNPPFGLFTSRSLDRAKELYPNSSNDIYACFVLRAVELSTDEGLVGVLSSRLGFFLEGLEEWRAQLLAHDGGLSLVVDLGYGVLDDALVETAGYVVDRRASIHELLALRLLGERDKESKLRTLIEALADGERVPEVFIRERRELASIPGKVVAYWLPEKLLHLLSQRHDLGKENIVAYSGLQTDDDYRFLRLWWEVSPEQEFWVPFAKGGEYLPFADDLHLVANWRDDGREMKAFVESKYRQWSRHIKNTDRFFRGGLTYTERTTSDISIRPLPRGAIFSVSGPCIQGPDKDSLELAWAALSSRPGRALVDTLVGSGDTSKSGTAARHYRTRLISAFPSICSTLGVEERDSARRDVRSLYCANMALRVRSEVHRLFNGLTVPGTELSTLTDWCRSVLHLDVVLFQEAARASAAIDGLVAKAFGLEDEAAISEFAGPHPLPAGKPTATQESSEKVGDVLAAMLSSSDEDVTRIALQAGLIGRVATKRCFFFSRELELACLVTGAHPRMLLDAAKRIPADALAMRVAALAFDLLSLALGLVIGRWRQCVVTAEEARRTVEMLDPLDELPTQAPAGLPGATRGVLVDDPGHAADIETLVIEALRSIPVGALDLPDQVAHATAASVREFFKREFFSRHIAGYSNSRRRAPIYWQLAPPSASYSVWLYYHTFTKDTLYKVQNDYVAQKLAHEERRLESLRRELGESPKAAERKALAAQEAFVEELRGFLDEVKRVAPLWKPNLDDGVVINFAPLWRLVSQHKTWQKELKTTWDALCAGDYDWTHLAMNLWPERVVPKCATDRSLAIAHGIEDMFWVEVADGEWKARTTPARPVDELVLERSSPAVKAALKSLLDAPTASGNGRARGRRTASSVATEGRSR